MSLFLTYRLAHTYKIEEIIMRINFGYVLLMIFHSDVRIPSSFPIFLLDEKNSVNLTIFLSLFRNNDVTYIMYNNISAENSLYHNARMKKEGRGNTSPTAQNE